MHLDPRTIGAAIRTRRTAAALTQAELAERLNMTAQSVSHWERGETLPDITILPDLACILGCSIDMLLLGQSGPTAAGSASNPSGRPSAASGSCGSCWARSTSSTAP